MDNNRRTGNDNRKQAVSIRLNRTDVRQIKGVIPAILITADHDDNLMRRALSEHAFCVLAKPVSRHVVIYVVHKALEKYYN